MYVKKLSKTFLMRARLYIFNPLTIIWTALVQRDAQSISVQVFKRKTNETLELSPVVEQKKLHYNENKKVYST